MKKIIVLFLAILFSVALASIAFAHPPKNVSLSWDQKTEVLSVKADHNVNDPAKHFVMSVIVSSKGENIFQKKYTKQNSPDFFTDKIHLKGLKSGTKIEVQIICNIMGIAKADYILP